MSTNLAETIPLGLPDFAAPEYEAQPRHIEIVSTRSQRRARPRPIYALIIVGGLFVLFIAQLLMSIVVSNGAYQISSLQTEQRTLSQTEQALTEQVDLLASPQSLTAKAKDLGMGESSRTPTFVNLAAEGTKGEIIGSEKRTTNVKSLGSNQVANALLDQKKEARAAAKAKAKADAKEAAATDTPAATTSTSTSSELPAISQ